MKSMGTKGTMNNIYLDYGVHTLKFDWIVEIVKSIKIVMFSRKESPKNV